MKKTKGTKSVIGVWKVKNGELITMDLLNRKKPDKVVESKLLKLHREHARRREVTVNWNDMN